MPPAPGLEAFEALVGDEVDDTADRIGAVRGRCAARHDVHPLDQQLRELADVGNTGHVRADHALAVEQRQRADRPEAVQREGAQALLSRSKC